MKQDVWAIHGGNPFDTYQEYLDYLKQKTTSRERIQRKKWADNLSSRLGSDFDVFTPEMPCKHNAKYSEWKIWFERLIPLMNENIILIGHSLGAIFLAKYFSEESFPHQTLVTILISAPIATLQDPFIAADPNAVEDHTLGDFILNEDLSKMMTTTEKLIFIHSHDDPAVPFINAEKYLKKLPQAEIMPFNDRGHFTQSEFPELEDLIKKVAFKK